MTVVAARSHFQATVSDETGPNRPYMPSPRETCRTIARITIVGTLPPLRAISGYCEGMALGVATHTQVEFFSFRALYPRFLYPGGAQEDARAREPAASNLSIKRTLAWYNPFSWFAAGMRFKGQILNLQWWSTPLFPILATMAILGRLRGIPVVTTIHNVVPHAGKSLAFRFASRLLYALSDRLIVHSRDNAAQLKTLYDIAPARILVSRMGSANFAKGQSYSQRDARQRLGLPQNRRILLMFGAVREYKGCDMALAALPAIAEAVPDTLLLIAGQPWRLPPSQQRMLEDAAASPLVRLDMHYIPDDAVHDYFAAADIVLLPYRPFSAQSGAGVSSLMYGLPLVVAHTGSLPELVRDPESVIPLGDVERLAKRVIQILTSGELYEKLAKDTETIAKHHSWEQIARELCGEFATLLEARSASD